MNHPALSLYRPLVGAKLRLLAFHHAGGGASAFNRLKAALAQSGVELCPLQLPGRENRLSEPLLHSCEAAVEELDSGIKQLPEMPTALLGHSMGSLLVYLLAQKWRREGRPAPLRCIVSAGLAPSSRTQLRDTYLLPEPEFQERVFALGGVPAPLREMPDLMQMFLPILRADYSLLDRYLFRPEPPLECPLSVYAGRDDQSAPLSQMAAWGELSTGPFQVHSFAGGHFYLYQQHEAVLERLRLDLR